MNMQNQLQKLADAVAAREGSPARERLLQKSFTESIVKSGIVG